MGVVHLELADTGNCSIGSSSSNCRSSELADTVNCSTPALDFVEFAYACCKLQEPGNARRHCELQQLVRENFICAFGWHKQKCNHIDDAMLVMSCKQGWPYRVPGGRSPLPICKQKDPISLPLVQTW